jgi:hypothetical protein
VICLHPAKERAPAMAEAVPSQRSTDPDCYPPKNNHSRMITGFGISLRFHRQWQEPANLDFGFEAPSGKCSVLDEQEIITEGKVPFKTAD